MPNSCHELRAAMAECLRNSDCIKNGNSASDCLRPPLVDELPDACKQLKKGYGECRRGLVDMRKRFRGNMPVTIESLQNADRGGDGYQLYAGSAAFSPAAKITDGNEPIPKDWREAENEKYRAEMAALAKKEKKSE